MRVTQLLVAAMRGSLSARIAPSRGTEMSVLGQSDPCSLTFETKEVGTPIILIHRFLLKILSTATALLKFFAQFAIYETITPDKLGLINRFDENY